MATSRSREQREADRLSRSTRNGLTGCGSGGCSKENNLARQRSRISPGVDRGQLTQRQALGDIDVQLASVDLCYQPRELAGVAADEDGHCANAACLLGHRRG